MPEVHSARECGFGISDNRYPLLLFGRRPQHIVIRDKAGKAK